MSRSTSSKKELPDGHHYVVILKAIQENNEIVVTFADGKNKQIDKSYNPHSSEFLKMCHNAGTINSFSVFHSITSLGKSLWITVSMGNVVETHFNVQVGNMPTFVKDKPKLPSDKKKVIEDARKMIKSIEVGAPIESENIFAKKLSEEPKEDDSI